MKFILAILAISALSWFTSCTKKIDVIHNNYDTVYLTQLKVDTFHTIIVRTDTVVKNNYHSDTVVQVKVDTLFLIKTTTDTLFRTYLDTVYLTKGLHDTLIQVKTIIQHDTLIQTKFDTTVRTVVQHDTVTNTKIVTVPDTVTKLVYLRDTINNIMKVFITDTIIKVNTVVTYDTVLRYQSLYPVPATDSVVMRYFLDPNDTTIHYNQYGSDSGSFVHVFSVTFTSVIASPDGTYQTFTAYPQIGDFFDRTIQYLSHNQSIIVAPKMLCTIKINWSWHGGAQASMIGWGPLEQMPTTVWKIWGYGKIAACGDPYNEYGSCSNTSFAIPLDDVKEIYVSVSGVF